MNILLTGASGFIGQHLYAALCHDHNVFTAVEESMDLRSAESVNRAVKATQPDIVIHLAAKTEVAYSFDDFEDFSRVNYIGTVLLAEANRLYNPNLKQFIMASTMETYGHQPEQKPFTEETPQYPMAPYAVAKLACEKYLAYMAHAYNFPSTILRQTNAYGRTNNNFFVMERILSQMLTGDVCNLGEPDPIRNFLFIDDLVELYKAIIGNEKAIGETFVTGPDNGITIRELVDRCSDVLNWGGRVQWHTIPKRPGEIFYLNSNPAKAKHLLGWEPKVGLTEGIGETGNRLLQSGALKAAA